MSDKKFLSLLVGLTVFLAALPFIIGMLTAPPGGSYLGYQFGTDDHMVYSAWMRQAMDGHFFLDNRFTTVQQPGITVHVYFFMLGLIAKITGIPIASALSRLFFSGLFIVLMWRLIQRLGWNSSTTRFASLFTVVGGGIGFLVWHTFGVAIVSGSPAPLSDLLGGLLPTDVWQPEGFVFPSMLVNGLFMVSLCLIVTTFRCLLDAKESWKPVGIGALCLGILMNIHSYDVLLIALVMVGFLAASIYQKQVTRNWVIRAAAIAMGAIPAALWFVHVLKSDVVFQARAQTDTPTANFKAVLFGYILMIILGLVGLANRPTEDSNLKKRRLAGVGLATFLFIGMYLAAFSSKDKYFLDFGGWAFIFVIALAATTLLSDENPVMNLIVSWALVGTVAIYFPGLFQRKLSMGLSIPWAILAVYGIETLLAKQEKSVRTLGTVLATLVLAATSVRWLGREFRLIQSNASNTSVQTAYIEPDLQEILKYLNAQHGRHVLIAAPGIPSPAFQKNLQESGTESITPTLADFNPIASGLSGVYTYAGHWSETPDYNKKRSVLSKLYFANIPAEARKELLKETGADFIVNVEAKAQPAPMFDFNAFGEAVVKGTRFSLIRVK